MATSGKRAYWVEKNSSTGLWEVNETIDGYYEAIKSFQIKRQALAFAKLKRAQYDAELTKREKEKA